MQPKLEKENTQTENATATLQAANFEQDIKAVAAVLLEKKESANRVRERCRRRLSVTHEDVEASTKDNDENRGLICSLEEKVLLDMVPPTTKNSNRRRWSIGSLTDSDMHRRSSFGDKSFTAHGLTEMPNFSPEEHGIGFACKKGLKPVSPNQDSFLILHVDGGTCIYGVFDGHGKRGHDVSNFVKDNLPKILVAHELFHTDLLAALRDSFLHTQRLLEHVTRSCEIDASTSGTTATVIVRRPDGLYCAHLGDSRAVLGLEEQVVDLTEDHKPNLPEERIRIESNGGVVSKQPYDINHRVYVKGEKYPGLAMSRALGDLIGYYYAGISCDPTVSFHPLRKDEPALLLVCSDGVWEFLSSQAAVQIAARQAPMASAEELCRVSWSHWIAEEAGQVVDDITAIVVNINYEF
jgi:serine/threonine protein phosphatase PrpC